MSKNFELLSRRHGHGEVVPSSTAAARGTMRWSGPPDAGDEHGFGWRQGINILRKHWRLATLFAIVTVVSTAAITLLMKPVYEPEALIEIEIPGNETFSLQNAASAQSDPDYLATQVQKLESNELGLAVVRRLRLAENREFAGAFAAKTAPSDGENAQITKAESAALRTLNSRLRVRRDTSSRLISVSFAGHDPVSAANIVNTLLDIFIDSTYSTRHDAILQSSAWLSKQLDDIRAKMEQSNKALADFQKNTGIADLGDGGSTFAQQINELNRQLTQAQADRIQMESFLERVKTSGIDSLPQVGASPVIQKLTQKLAETRGELAQTLAVYGKNHPNVKKLQNEANELEAQIRLERASIFGELKTSYAAARAREQLLTAQTKDSNKELIDLARYNQLKKEADTNSQLYASLYGRVKEAAISAESKSSNISLISHARVLHQPTAPHRLLNIELGLAVGLVGGILLAFMKEALAPGIRTLDDVRNCTGFDTVSIVPVIGTEEDKKALGNRAALLLPAKGGTGRPKHFFSHRPLSAEAEALRGIQTAIISANGPTQVMLIASAVPGEGKTTVAVNLASALAQHGSTCIVDADIRRPCVGWALGLDPGYSLSDVLTGSVALDDALLQPSPDIKLSVLQSSPEQSDPGKLICSEATGELIRNLRRRFRFVVIDAPPILPYADGRALAPMVDGVVFVCRSGVTSRDALVRSMELLSQVHSAPVVDIVLNAAEYKSPEYGYYYAQRERRA